MKIKLIDDDTIEIVKTNSFKKKKRGLDKLMSMPDKYRSSWWDV